MTVKWKPVLTAPDVRRAGEGDHTFTLLLDPYGLYILRAEDAERAAEDTLRNILTRSPNVFVAYEDMLDLPLEADPPVLTVISTKGDFVLHFPVGAAETARALRAEALRRRPAR